ncbi:unnamed protein product [Bursaphelenchus xylophilus]|uniref:(pine wood nematode) hypothetical protein n=1 Tax=Bursaphelenchus xylophilus TaxID=6326 RepID=A0A1I7RN19_BURXY|nr:unnamed protein product [Bursaphelenchus xylophilus]CAG9087586.1 unnamed protein product [Bursaphelenchus xylophilus]
MHNQAPMFRYCSESPRVGMIDPEGSFASRRISPSLAKVDAVQTQLLIEPFHGNYHKKIQLLLNIKP